MQNSLLQLGGFLIKINKMEEKLGKYLFMGMGKCNKETVCIAVAYKLDYCIKKANQFVKASKGTVEFTKINKILVGELEAEEVLSKTGETIKNR